MSRTEAILLSVLGGLVVLVMIGAVFVLLAPYELIFGPVATPTPAASPTPTLTPTFPSFLPTASSITPTPGEPTPTNTRLPTATPVSPQTPTPTMPFRLPTLVFRPTETPTSPPPTIAVTPPPTPTLVPGRQYTVRFEAEKTALEEGECTNLEWQVEGPATVWLNGKQVAPAKTEKICPGRDTDYVLTIQLAGSAELRREIVRIFVDE